MHTDPLPEEPSAPPPVNAAGEACLLAIRGLICARNDVTLLRDLEFGLQSGRILLIEGENGSGKTTLLRILCGLLEPEAGEVLWYGRDIRNDYSAYLRALCYVGHGNGIKLGLTPRENLALARDLAAAPRNADLGAVLERVGVGRYADVPAQYLSAGQRRRLALARLLLDRRPLWILDEPFTSLDASGRSLLRGIFKDHLAAHGAIVMTSHDPIVWRDPPVQRLGLS